MSGPITSLDVLNREYAVEGWTWVAFAVGTIDVALRRNDGLVQWFADHDGTLGSSISGDGDLHTIEFLHPRVAITVCCAHLGVPTPWRAAERLDAAGDGHYGTEAECAEARGLYSAARMLRGEP